jgi:pre-mRNA-splicing factor ATP-dependent RNA helicase DHX15/PRP43
LLDYAANYFDLASFPDGETKRALQRVVNKKQRKTAPRVDAENGPAAKKRKKNKQ